MTASFSPRYSIRPILRIFRQRFASATCWRWLPILLAVACFAALGVPAASAADDPVFSGPQVGEKLPPFTVRGVFDDDAGQELDFVSRADGKPIVLIFVHDVNRQSIGLTRVLSTYTMSRAKDGLVTGIVWLDDDATEAENTLKRIRHALTPKAPTGISVDGREGPGSYGLNRNMTLTILVGKAGKVTANFALTQPSIQADLPKILDQVVAVAGGRAPKLEELEGVGPVMRRDMPPAPANQPEVNLRPLLGPVIRKNASVEDVDAAARKLEDFVRENDAARRELGRVANTIIQAGKLKDYGTERAQHYLTKWAKEYGTAAADRATSPNESNSPKEKRGEPRPPQESSEPRDRS